MKKLLEECASCCGLSVREMIMRIIAQNILRSFVLIVWRVAKKWNVDKSNVGKHLHAIGMLQNEGSWMPHKLKKRHVEMCLVTCQVLFWIITHDEKLINYKNHKHPLMMLLGSRECCKFVTSETIRNHHQRLLSKLSNSQPAVPRATLDSTRVAQIRIPWEKAEINSSQR